MPNPTTVFRERRKPSLQTQLYQALSQCDQAIIRSTGREQLFEPICRAIVEIGGMKAAWVGMLDAAQRHVVPVAESGNCDGYLATLQITVDPNDAMGRGPTGTAIREDRAIWCQDVAQDPSTLPWRERYALRGWAASAAIPLRCGGAAVGALCLYAQAVDAFDESVRGLLLQMASNISYALDAFEQQQRRLRAQQALLESEARYSTLFANGSMPKLLIDPVDGSIVDANVRATEFYGWDRATLQSMNITDINTLSADELRVELELVRHEQKSHFDFRHRRCNGEIREVEVFAGTINVAGRELLLSSVLDVSERHYAEQRTQALLQLNELGGTLPEREFLTTGLELAERLTHSTIGFLHFVNDDQETLELVTWTAGALTGCTAAYDAHYPISQAGIWADCFRKKQAVMFNDYASYPAKRGLPAGHAPLQRLISVPVIEDSRVRMMLGVGNRALDYSEEDVNTLRLIGNDLWRIVRRARAEAALQQRVDELVAVNLQLSRAQLQLLQAEKMASIGQLAAGVAHEINNPMGYVKSNFSVLARYVDDLLATVKAYDEVELQLGEALAPAFAHVHERKRGSDHDFLVAELKPLIRESREGVDRVIKIVQDLKTFSRVGDNDWQWSDLHAGLESTIGVAWNQLKYKVELVRDYGTLPQVYCLASQINQVLLNLLVNAAQAIAEHGHIWVRTGADAQQAWIEVQDDGCGIEPQLLDRIFEPFYTSKPAGQGTGLGLSVAWGIVERHHGKIAVESKPGQGSRFRVILPLDPRARSQPIANRPLP